MSKKSDLEELFLFHVEKGSHIGTPDTEHYFAKPRQWRFDFAWPSVKLAVEIEGGTWLTKSRHTSGTGFAKDCEKYNEAALLGWRVLRFTSNQVKSGHAISTVERFFSRHTTDAATD